MSNRLSSGAELIDISYSSSESEAAGDPLLGNDGNSSAESCTSEVNIDYSELSYEGLSTREFEIFSKRPFNPSALKFVSALAVLKFLFTNGHPIPRKTTHWSLISAVIHAMTTRDISVLKCAFVNETFSMRHFEGCRNEVCQCVVNMNTVCSSCNVALLPEAQIALERALQFSVKNMRKYLKKNLHIMHKMKDNCRLSLATQIRWLIEDDNEVRVKDM